MAGLHFDITGDNSNFLRKLEEARNGVVATSKKIEESGMSIEQLYKRMTSAVAGFGVALSAKEIVSNVVRIRGEFQQLEVAFKTMLGSEEQANTLMGQLVNTAAKTPFDLQGIANGAKQLLAYGTATEDVNNTLIRLGDIAAGLSIHLNDLVWLYGTTMTQGRLFTQDLRQFQGRGIPLADELAKQFGVAKDKVGELVTAGKVGFPEVQKAIEAMTNDGGKFGGLMEAQSKTITGQISNIEDSIATMYNNIGKQSEGFINDALSGVSYLVDNYEEIGKIVLELVGTYGAYKAVLITITALQRVNSTVIAQAAVEQQLVAMAGHKLSDGQALAAAKTKLLTIAQQRLTKSLKAAGAALTANPYIIAAAAIVGVSLAIYKVVTAENEFDKATKRLNDANANIEKSLASEVSKLTSLERKLSETKKGTEEYNKIKKTIVDNYGQYYKGLDGEIERIGNLSTVYGQLVEKMRLSIGHRKFESFFKAEQDNLDKVIGEKLDKAYDTLIEKYGNDKGAKLYQQVFDYAIRGTSMSADTWKQLREATFSEWGFDNSPVGFASRSVSSLVIDMNQVARASSQALDDFKTKYQMTEKDIENILSGKPMGGENVNLSTVSDEISAATKKIATLKQELADLRSGKTIVEAGKTVQSVIEEKEKELKAAEAALATLTGKTVKETDKGLKVHQELSRSILDSELKLQADRIAIMKDGKDKRVLLADQEYKETLATIRKQKEEYQKKVKEAGQREDPAVMATFASRESAARSKRDTDVAGINKEYFDDYAKRTKALTDVFLSEEKKRLSAVKERYDEERKWAQEQLNTGGMSEEQYQSYVINIDKAEAEESLRSLLDKYQDYATERKRIEEQFQAEIETLEKGRTQNNAASVDAAIAEARKKEREALSNLDLENLQKEIDWSTVFGDLEKVSTSTLRRLQEQLKNYLSNVGDTISKEDLKVVTDALTQIGEVQADRRPIDELKSGYESYTQACEKVAAAQQKVNELEAKGDKTSEDYKKAVKGLTAAQDERRSSLVSMTQAVNSMGQKGGELVQAGSDITGMLTDLGVKIPESIAGALDGLGQIASSLSSIDLTKPFSIITGITGMIGGIGKTIGSLFNKDHKKEKNIERLQVQVEELDKSYEKLSDSIEKAYSVDASELIEQQNEMLKKQKLLIQQQIAEEESKKHSDNDRIKEWKNQLEDIDKTLADNKEKAKDAIFGEDLKSAIDNFANAYAEAWAAGEDRAASMKDVARNMIKQTVIELIKSSAGLGETVKKIREMILGFLSDGVVDEWEQRELDSYIESETARLDAKYGWADKYMKEDKGIDLGISGDSLADTIVEGLRAGKAGIKDFSGSFEEMMKTAVLNSLKTKYLEGPLKEFQKKFAALSESGGQLTEAEIEELRAMYAEIIDGAKVQFDSLKEISGLDFLDDSDNTLKGAFAKASQESIDLIAGQFGAMRFDMEAILNIMVPIREQMQLIYALQTRGWEDVKAIRELTDKVNKNSERVADNTREIKDVAGKISENTKRTLEKLEGRIDVNIKGM